MTGSAFDVERLRREFDQSFALPYTGEASEYDDYLLIRAGERAYALVARDVGEVAVEVPITPLPARTPGFLGLAGRRGKLVPVFDLAFLVGGVAGEGRRWLALSTSNEPVGFAFAALEGQLRQARSALLASARDAGFVRGALEADGLRPIVDCARIVRELQEKPGRQRLGKGV